MFSFLKLENFKKRSIFKFHKCKWHLGNFGDFPLTPIFRQVVPGMAKQTRFTLFKLNYQKWCYKLPQGHPQKFQKAFKKNCIFCFCLKSGRERLLKLFFFKEIAPNNYEKKSKNHNVVIFLLYFYPSEKFFPIFIANWFFDTYSVHLLQAFTQRKILKFSFLSFGQTSKNG